MEKILRMEFSAENIPQYCKPLGALYIKNKCCANQPVIVTKTHGTEVYSCQCACGGWCTNGCDSVQDAITEWLQMK